MKSQNLRITLFLLLMFIVTIAVCAMVFTLRSRHKLLIGTTIETLAPHSSEQNTILVTADAVDDRNDR